MAIARLSVKVGKAGKAAPHADYIAREGPYANRLERGETLEAKEAGNMPAWAADSPGRFWHAADAFERANGTTYRELELSLPRELSAEDRAALVRAFVSQELGERHPYQWAIHRPKAADGKDQPHAHLMFSERRQDGIERDPDQFFKRYNAKAPEKGGAHKRFGEVDGPNRSQAQRAADLRALRGRWGEMVNSHLERAGVSERIDMRSLKAQGIDRAPEKKQTPRAWRDPQQRATVLEYRQIHRERDQAAAEYRALVPEGRVVNLEAHAAKLEAIRNEIQAKAAAQMAELKAVQEATTTQLEAKQAAEATVRAPQRADDAAERERVAAADARQRAEKERENQEQAAALEAQRAERLEEFKRKLAALTTAPKAPTIEQPTAAPAVEAPAQLPEVTGLHSRNFGTIPKAPAQEPKKTEAQRGERKALEMIDRGPPGTAERLYDLALGNLQTRVQAEATAALEAARAERRQWNEACSAHNAGKPGMVRLPGRLDAWKQAGAALEQYGRDLSKRETAAEWAARPEVIQAVATAKVAEQMPRFTERAAADRQARLDREAKEQQARIEAAKREKAAKDLERANARVGKDFDLMADKRRFKMFGFHDHSDDWKATPPALRDRIDEYNKLPERERAAELEKINRDPATKESIKDLLEQREQAIQRQGRSR